MAGAGGTNLSEARRPQWAIRPSRATCPGRWASRCFRGLPSSAYRSPEPGFGPPSWTDSRKSSVIELDGVTDLGPAGQMGTELDFAPGVGGRYHRGSGSQDLSRLPSAELGRSLRSEDAVDPGGATAQAVIAQLDRVVAGCLEHPPRLSCDPLSVPQVARVLDGDRPPSGVEIREQTGVDGIRHDLGHVTHPVPELGAGGARPVPVLLEMGAAPRRVDHDDVEPLEGSRRSARPAGEPPRRRRRVRRGRRNTSGPPGR